METKRNRKKNLTRKLINLAMSVFVSVVFPFTPSHRFYVT